ncbi:hypothetical protein JCM9533A_08310 [Catenuloplanes niger JCM 9533]
MTTAGAATVGVVAAGLPAGPAAAAPNDTHLLIGTPTSPAKLLHKLRQPNELWIPSPEWGDVYAVAKSPYPSGIVDVAGAMVGNQMHTVSAQHSQIAHAVRTEGGGWTVFNNISGFGAGNPAENRRVCAAGAAGNLHLAVLAWDGGVFHTIRKSADWLWTPLTRVPGWGSTNFTDIAAGGGSDGYFHLFALQGTQVLHRVRDPHTGIWSTPGSPGSATGSSGTAIAAGRAGNEVHAAVVTDAGLSHVVRYLSGSWSDVNLLQRIPDIDDVGAAGTPNGEFHVTIVGTESGVSGIQYWVKHRVRRADQSWTGFATLDFLRATRAAMAG